MFRPERKSLSWATGRSGGESERSDESGLSLSLVFARLPSREPAMDLHHKLRRPRGSSIHACNICGKEGHQARCPPPRTCPCCWPLARPLLAPRASPRTVLRRERKATRAPSSPTHKPIRTPLPRLRAAGAHLIVAGATRRTRRCAAPPPPAARGGDPLPACAPNRS